MSYRLVGILTHDFVYHKNEISKTFAATAFTALSDMWAVTEAATLLRMIVAPIKNRELSFIVFKVGDLFVIDGAAWKDTELLYTKRFSSVEHAINAVRFGWRPKP